MSKRAEQKALEAHPVEVQPLVYEDLIEQFGGKTEVDVNIYQRRFFQEGYEHAEKDLTLTWKDVRNLCDCFMDVGLESNLPARSKEFYTEVLNRFNKSKEER